jgi:hypothetical protein
MAREAGADITIDDFDRIHRQIPVLANVKTAGKYPVEYFWYAAGVPAVMLELRDIRQGGRAARACLKGRPGWVVGHKLVTWRVGARNAMRSPVDESSAKKTFTPETSCLPYRPAAGRT